MRVLIDATYARRAPYSGTAVYIERLASALDQLPGVSVELVTDTRRRAPAGGGAASAANALEDVRWTQYELPRRARAARADVLHHPLPALAHVHRALPQVITVHDLAFELLPGRFSPEFLLERGAARAG